MSSKQKQTEVKTSEGWFTVTYGRYYAGSKPTYDDPGDPPDVDIIDVAFIDPEEEYDDTIEGFTNRDSFMQEIADAVIEQITDGYNSDEEAAAEARYEARYEARFDSVYF